MSRQEIRIAEGYEEVPAGEPASFAQYRCEKCKTVFVAAHYASARAYTGHTISCCGEPAWWIRNVKRKDPAVKAETSPQSIEVECAANLTASSQCPSDCRKCFYGGEIAIQWSLQGQGYVQYYPNREVIEVDRQNLRSSGIFPNYSPYVHAKMASLTEWLDKNPINKDIHCNFCDGELGDVEKQPHDNPNFAEYRTCLKCGYQWAKEYWAWLAKEQGVSA
jgi:transposase-like protein